MQTVKRLEIKLTARDVKILEELKIEIKESNASIIRRALENYYKQIKDK